MNIHQPHEYLSNSQLNLNNLDRSEEILQFDMPVRLLGYQFEGLKSPSAE